MRIGCGERGRAEAMRTVSSVTCFSVSVDTLSAAVVVLRTTALNPPPNVMGEQTSKGELGRDATEVAVPCWRAFCF